MTAALRKVGLALTALIDTASAASVQYDRNEDEPLGEDEGDTIVVRLLASDISQGPEMSGSTHRATYQIEIMAREATGETRDEAVERMAGEVLAAIHSDRSLGGRVASVEEQAFTPASKPGQDATSAQMEVLIMFFTPRGDFNTIVGHGGTLF